MNPYLSVVISVFNEADGLESLWSDLSDVISKSEYATEIIWVNDGSTDSSQSAISKIVQSNSLDHLSFREIQLSKNFGHEAAMTAGIDHANGEYVICMDADLQHPPAEIPRMITKAQEGFDIINMIRDSKREKGATTNLFSKTFYAIMNRFSDYQFEENASDFFLISKRVVDVLKSNYRERNRFVRGYIQVMGFDKTSIKYQAATRTTGVSKYNKRKLFKLAVAAISSFSKKPLFFALGTSFAFAILSILLAVYSIWMFFFGDAPPSGYTTLIVFMSVCFTIVYVLLAIISIYLGFNFEEVKDRPIYLVKESKSTNPKS